MPPFALLWVAARRGWVSVHPGYCLAAMLVALLVGTLMPGTFAQWHQGMTRVQSWIGQRLVGVLLGLVFIGVLLPLGMLFRLRGRSFMDAPTADSYWKPARAPGSLRDQF